MAGPSSGGRPPLQSSYPVQTPGTLLCISSWVRLIRPDWGFLGVPWCALVQWTFFHITCCVAIILCLILTRYTAWAHRRRPHHNYSSMIHIGTMCSVRSTEYLSTGTSVLVSVNGGVNERRSGGSVGREVRGGSCMLHYSESSNPSLHKTCPKSSPAINV